MKNKQPECVKPFGLFATFRERRRSPLRSTQEYHMFKELLCFLFLPSCPWMI